MSSTRGLSIALFSALVVGACGSDTINSLRPEKTWRRASAISGQPPLNPLTAAYGPVRFVRTPGAPDVYQVAVDLSKFEGPFVLRITNGDGSAGSKIRAGSVAVNGAQILENRELGSIATSFVSEHSSIASIGITLAGQPGAFLTVQVDGHPRRWRVCPGENFYRTYATVQAAVAAADPGATIWICDGIHDAMAVVNKPLTIRSEHSGAATLRDMLVWAPNQPAGSSGGIRPVFWVQGISSGTFRIADINFVLRQSALVAIGTWDKVEIDSVNFAGLDSSHVFAVRSFSSSVSGAHFEVNRSRFESGALGVFAVGGEVNVRNSAFQEMGQPVVYTSTAVGRVETSSFVSCNLTGCVRIMGRGGVTVAGNTIDRPASGPSGTGVQIFSNTNAVQSPIIVEDNVMTGSPALANPTNLNSWSLTSGVQVLTNFPVPPSSIIVRRNHITQAGAGIAVNSANGSIVHATDNIIANVYTGLVRNGNVLPNNPTTINNGTIVFRRNDIINAMRSFGDFGAGPLDVTCNWWGSTSGPVNTQGVGGPPPASVYTPWAMQPIAGKPEVGCP